MVLNNNPATFRYAGVIAVALLSGCAMDPADSTYSTMNLGLSSGDGFSHRQYGMSHYRDNDGDGLDNALDRHPRNPYRD